MTCSAIRVLLVLIWAEVELSRLTLCRNLMHFWCKSSGNNGINEHNGIDGPLWHFSYMGGGDLWWSYSRHRTHSLDSIFACKIKKTLCSLGPSSRKSQGHPWNTSLSKAPFLGFQLLSWCFGQVFRIWHPEPSAHTSRPLCPIFCLSPL